MGVKTSLAAISLSGSDLTVAAAAGCDVKGLLQLAELKCAEASAICNYLATDVLTSGQDSTANTALTTAITNLS